MAHVEDRWNRRDKPSGATVPTVNHGKGKRWRARYRDEAEKEHARHFDRKTDAQRWLDQVTASVVRGDYVDPRAGRMTVAEYAALWEPLRLGSDGTKRLRDNAIRLHIVPALGQYRLSAVLPSHVEALVKGLTDKGLSAGSVRNIYEVAARIFASAVRDRKIAASPCLDIALPKDTSGEVEPPTLEQVEAVRAQLDDRWQAVVVVLAGTGLRVGELLGLVQGDVNFLRRTVRVERQRLQSNEVAELKTLTSKRTVPVGQVTLDVLAAHMAQYPASDSALFTDEFGSPLTYRRWKKLLSAAADAAGVPMTSHSLRHYCASAALSGGASIVQVQKMLGHKDATITLRTYAHLVPGDDDRTRNALDAALGRADFLRTEAASS